jgi:hypothetical protein
MRISNILVILMGILSVPVLAHHSFTAHFDMSRRLEIRGTVVDYKLRSPHSSLVVDGIAYVDGVAQGDDVQRWEVESMAASGLRQMGMTAETFQAGDAITLIGNPNREPGFRFVNASTFIDGNGRQFSFRDRQPFEKVDADALIQVSGLERLAGRWSSPGGFAGNGTPLPLNARGQRAWDSYEAKESPANTCEPMNFPDMFNAPYLFDLRIEDGVAILYNVPWEVERRIPINGQPTRPRLDGLFGVVLARQEGEDLVLESGGYIPSAWGLGSATQKLGGGRDMPASARKRVTERFSVSDDGQTLVYEYTVTDPIYLRAPYSDRLELSRVADSTPLYDYVCEQEAASMWSRTASDPALRVGN